LGCINLLPTLAFSSLGCRSAALEWSLTGCIIKTAEDIQCRAGSAAYPFSWASFILTGIKPDCKLPSRLRDRQGRGGVPSKLSILLLR
jgi:hypothetical protein